MENLFLASVVSWYKIGSWAKAEENFLSCLEGYWKKINPNAVNGYNVLYNLVRSEQWLFIGEWIVHVYVCIYL